MAVFRVEKNHNYTVMSNYHLRDTALTLKAIGLLSKMLSLTDEWDYTTRGLAAICKEGVDAIGAALKELEARGYLVRRQIRDSKSRITDTEYTIYESPHTPLPDTACPDTENPYLDTPDTDEPYTEKPAQLNKDRRNKEAGLCHLHRRRAAEGHRRLQRQHPDTHRRAHRRLLHDRRG